MFSKANLKRFAWTATKNTKRMERRRKKGLTKYNKKFQKFDLTITCMWQQQHPIFLCQ